MLSLRLEGNYLDIRSEIKMSQDTFQNFTSFMRSLRGSYYEQDNYRWLVPKSHIDTYMSKYEEVTACHTTIEKIKGIEEVLVPDFVQLSNDEFKDFKLEPYEFQKQGISFLVDVGSGIIGDDMGLGKTPQTMGAAHILHKRGLANKILVICPASLKYQWSSEISKFLGHKNIVIDGKTTKQKQQAFQKFIEGDYLFGIVNYELVRSMSVLMSKYSYDVIIADEAHRLKNRESQTYKAVSSLKSTYKFAATGTPLQNNVEELYALISWIRPGLLGKITEFRKRYIVYGRKFNRYVPIGPKRLGELRRIYSPYMLRRMKKDVAKDLPPIIYHRRDVEMNKDQAKLYEKIQSEFIDLMDELKNQEVRGQFDSEGNWVEEKRNKEDQVLGYLYLMIATSDHPELLKHGKGMSKRYVDMIPDNIKSPKLDELIDTCKEQIEAGTEKIVIFTQFARMQAIIEKHLSKLGKVGIVNGSMHPAKRQEVFDTFKNNNQYKFLIGTDAMNYGVNLQFANTLINYDSPWNPAIVAQREGRVHRIGSSHDVVNIINFVTLGTIDEKIQATLESKRALGDVLVERNESERSLMNSLISSIRKEKEVV